MTGLPDEPWPSLHVVRHELDVEAASLERRSAGLDTKAGLLLAVSGVLVGLGATDPNQFDIAGQVLAAVAGGCAIWAFLPRVAGAIGPRPLRDGYLSESPEQTRLVVLNTRIALHEADEQSLHEKLFRIKLALTALALSGVLVIAGSIVEASTGGGDGDDAPSGTASIQPR